MWQQPNGLWHVTGTTQCYNPGDTRERKGEKCPRRTRKNGFDLMSNMAKRVPIGKAEKRPWNLWQGHLFGSNSSSVIWWTAYCGKLNNDTKTRKEEKSDKLSITADSLDYMLPTPSSRPLRGEERRGGFSGSHHGSIKREWASDIPGFSSHTITETILHSTAWVCSSSQEVSLHVQKGRTSFPMLLESLRETSEWSPLGDLTIPEPITRETHPS